MMQLKNLSLCENLGAPNVFENPYYSFALPVSIPFYNCNEIFRYFLGEFLNWNYPQIPFSLKWLQDWILRLFSSFRIGKPTHSMWISHLQKFITAILVLIFFLSLVYSIAVAATALSIGPWQLPFHAYWYYFQLLESVTLSRTLLALWATCLLMQTEVSPKNLWKHFNTFKAFKRGSI